MRFDLHLRADLKGQLAALGQDMAAWELRPLLDEEDRARLLGAIEPFEHTTRAASIKMVGVDGSGVFPALSYSDSFVYCSVATAVCYESDFVSGLREIPVSGATLLELTWLAEDAEQRRVRLDAALERLASRPLTEVVTHSDYRRLKAQRTGTDLSVEELINALIRPAASDSGNLGIQLRSTAELGAAARVVADLDEGSILLLDGTLSLPFVSRTRDSLFHEHLKRLCCVEARARASTLVTVSKSHGLPGIGTVETLAREKLGTQAGKVAEHWFVRVPTLARDGWELPLVGDRNVPPPGAVTYLVRFHRNVPVLRLDFDEAAWGAVCLRGSGSARTAWERTMLERLDYACHDQRCFGYPYPLKAAHDRASLTATERGILRRQIVDAAVAAGVPRRAFRSASEATGHA